MLYGHHFLFILPLGETTLLGEAMYDPKVHLSYYDLAVDDALTT